MAYLAELVDHPIALLVALVLSAPLVWQVARSWFSSIEEDVKEAAPFAAVDAMGGPTIITWPILKIVWFVAVSAAIVVSFYKAGSWIAEL